MSLSIENNMIVNVHYTLKNNDGDILDSSEGSEPLIYLHGAENIISGLEKALAGKSEGDSLQVVVEPSEGYGEALPELIEAVGVAAFNGVESIEPGMTFETEAPDGTVHPVLVTKVEDDQVTIDGNHPLAGVTLNFDVQIVSVKHASEDEIAHQHVHLDDAPCS
jgi:FKBP-type peptidyl-prolyl cis-trans isomerase SlyD